MAEFKRVNVPGNSSCGSMAKEPDANMLLPEISFRKRRHIVEGDADTSEH